MADEGMVLRSHLSDPAGERRKSRKANVDAWFPLIYDCLHDLAERRFAQETPGHTFQPTVIVHEAYVRLAEGRHEGWRDRTHFFAVAARALREVLVDHARRKASAKRGGDRHRVALEGVTARADGTPIDLLALDEALSRLAVNHGRASRVVELRYFGGLTITETAQALGISAGTVKLDWRFARAWLNHELQASV